MKFEIDFLGRAYFANLLRIRAARQRELADERSMSATREELRREADYCEEQARELDDAFEPAAVSERKPIMAASGPGAKDVTYVDGEKREQNGVAKS